MQALGSTQPSGRPASRLEESHKSEWSPRSQLPQWLRIYIKTTLAVGGGDTEFHGGEGRLE